MQRVAGETKDDVVPIKVDGAGAGLLGRRLREWRSGARLSLAAAARCFGVHPTSYRRWEQGQRPYPRHFPAIGCVLSETVGAVSVLAGPPHRRPGRPAPPDASPLMRARLAAGYNRVDMGRALHVAPATIYQWEQRNVRPSVGLLPDLARVLGLTAHALHEAIADYPPCRHDGAKLPTLGGALRRRGVSRRRVGELLGIAYSTAFEWETGRRRVPVWAVRELSRECRISVDSLLEEARHTHAPARVRALTAMRRDVRMSQKEAAAILGISPTTLARYERGERSMALPVTRGMARLYRVPLSRVQAAAGLTLPAILLAPAWSNRELPTVLTELRRAAGLSMNQVARFTGVSHSTVRRWETGRSTPSSQALTKLEFRYHLTPRRLTSLR
jgi:transcriptional regulator with XRE-family HTH domain